VRPPAQRARRRPHRVHHQAGQTRRDQQIGDLVDNQPPPPPGLRAQRDQQHREPAQRRQREQHRGDRPRPGVAEDQRTAEPAGDQRGKSRQPQ
jgi:hypothetical protein